MSGAPALDWSTPAFAHVKPWRVRQIRRPWSARRSSAGLVEDDLDVARVLAVLGGERAGALAGLDVGQRPHAPLGLRDDLVRDRRARRRGRAAGRAARRRAARRGRRRGGPPADPAAGEREVHRQTACAEAIPSSSARVRGAPPARAASAARSAARSPGVSTSSSSEGRRPIRTRAPAAWASAAWRANDPGRTRGRPPPAARSAARSCPRRGGRGRSRHRAPAPPAAPSPRPARARGSRPGRAAPAPRPAPPPRGRRAAPPPTARPPRGRARPGRRARSGAARAASLELLRGHDDDAVQPLHPPQRLEHVTRHRPRQRAAIVGPHSLAEALLGEAEGLDGEDGQRAQGTPEGYPRRAAAKFRASRATRRRASASPISTSVSSVGTSLARSSLTRPSISPA